MQLFTTIVVITFIFSCKENKATPIETKVIEVKNNEHPNITFEYAFYKAFADCNSEIGYFTQEEAQKLYAEKEITIDIKQGTRENKKNVFSDDKLNCLEEHLRIEINKEVLKFNPKDTFPFDNLLLINNKYIIVSRDACFFVFKIKNEQMKII